MRGFALFVLGVPTVAFGVWTVVCVFRGAWFTAVVALAGAIFWGTGAAVWAMLPTCVPFATADPSGTTVRPDRRVDRLMKTGMAAGILGLGGIGVFGPLGWLDLPIPRTMDGQWMFLVPFAAPAVVGLVALGISVRRGGWTRTKLTLDGFEFAEGFKTKRGSWADVVAVANEAPDAPQAKSPLVIRMADGSSVTLMESALLGPRDGLFKLVEHQWRNPDARAELVDGRAVARLLASCGNRMRGPTVRGVVGRTETRHPGPPGSRSQ